LAHTGAEWKIIDWSTVGNKIVVTVNRAIQLIGSIEENWRILPGKIPFVDEPDRNLGLIRLTGDGDLDNGSLILVHGFNDIVDSLKGLREKLVFLGYYRNAYSLSYD